VSRPRTSSRYRVGELQLWWWGVAVGLVGLAIGGPALINSLRFVATAQQATGVIVDVVPAEEDYRPVVQFTTAHGQRVEFAAGETAGDQSYYRVGQHIGVLYSANNPNHARLDSWQSRWGLDAIVPALGIFILVISIISLRVERRTPPGAYCRERLVGASAAQTYVALTTAVSRRFTIGQSDDSAMSISFSSGRSAFTWGENFVADVTPAEAGAVIQILGAGKMPTVLLQTRRISKLIERLFADVTEVLDPAAHADDLASNEYGQDHRPPRPLAAVPKGSPSHQQ
jgi:hypothetical protein